jgi:diaminopimelate epimerase
MDAFEFVKISATGNDFILLDNRTHRFDADRDRVLWSRLCARRRSIGADGVILLEESDRADFRYVHINSDGSIAGMCGNGSRAIAYFAHTLGITGSDMCFDIEGMIYRARVDDARHVVTEFVPPQHMEPYLDVDPDVAPSGGFYHVGVPHLVLFCEDIDGVELDRLGPYFRHHRAFPDGCNVDAVEIVDGHHIRIRTWERGVEGETLACGTGAVASALAGSIHHNVRSPILCTFPGGDLTVNMDDSRRRMSLAGPVDPVYEGRMIPSHLDAV